MIDNYSEAASPTIDDGDDLVDGGSSKISSASSISSASALSKARLTERNAADRNASDRSSAERKSPAAKGSSGNTRCVVARDPNLVKLADAIAAKVGPQRFHVWFDNSTRLDLRNDNLEIAVPNDFIGEWIGQRFTGTIQEAAVEVFGGPLRLRFQVVPELFKVDGKDGGKDGGTDTGSTPGSPMARVTDRDAQSRIEAPGVEKSAKARAILTTPAVRPQLRPDGLDARGDARPVRRAPETYSRSSGSGSSGSSGSSGLSSGGSGSISATGTGSKHRLRHDFSTFIVGPSNQLAFNAAEHVAKYPGTQYNPLFIHGSCGLGKTHMIQGLCQLFIKTHATKRWTYMTGEEFTNDYVLALRHGKVDAFRRRMREVDLLVIDDVHFLAGKKATQEEFLHTFNAIEALGKQVVMASDAHPKEISEFGESLVSRFVSGMVVRVDAPNFSMRCDILRGLAAKQHVMLSEELIAWVARRVTQNVRELEGAITRISAHVTLTGRSASVELAQEALGDLDRHMVAPVKPENIVLAVAGHFGIEAKDIMSGNRHRTVSLARSVAMFLIRKTAKLSFPEIGARLGKRNHSTVISACRRIETAMQANEVFDWSSATGERKEEAAELLARLEDQARSMA